MFIENEIRELFSGGTNAYFLDYLDRDLILTFFEGDYNQPTGYVLTLRGSPCRGTIFYYADKDDPYHNCDPFYKIDQWSTMRKVTNKNKEILKRFNEIYLKTGENLIFNGASYSPNDSIFSKPEFRRIPYRGPESAIMLEEKRRQFLVRQNNKCFGYHED